MRIFLASFLILFKIGSHCEDQAGLVYLFVLFSASLMLELQVYTIMPNHILLLSYAV